MARWPRAAAARASDDAVVICGKAVELDPASDEPMAEQLGRALGASEPRSRLCALLRDWDVGGTGTIEAADFRQAPAG